MINRVQKENNPHGQGLLGLLHDYTTNKNGLDLKDYIQNISEFDDLIFINFQDEFYLIFIFIISRFV